MALNTDKNSYTIIFSVLMVAVVGSLLAFTAKTLEKNIKANKRTEKQQNILFAMGVTDQDDPNEFVPAEKADELFNQYVGENQYIVMGSTAEKTTKAFEIDVKKENDKIKNDPTYERKMPLFVGEKEGKKYYIVPMRGNGLWDAIWGYISLGSDFKYISGAFFDHKGETPGLGANITEAYFEQDFIGESILDENGNYVGVEVKKGNADPKNERKEDNAVDALAGATITGNGVTAMVKKGIKMYMPYFESIK
ncbi:Na(+)-translocating NADH-quinone reductase subunit C [Aquimarina brevivitae]|uniref:Na(+)-translocating NADH-quinone reductase subunit C n=1 Tax=Aquimarina brevivitae TaxID=323412 RepID=A0A4Q7NY79_9FLAO|nr:Na(+)-translocating NADH-quinone reductase subunit C [Aquimarina brevivitae]RZS91970.1 Na+-transporting NADH:ubiquinone oxidoreductase subunit C [Aquimarina brevivitae]